MVWRNKKIKALNITFITFITPNLEGPNLSSLEVGGYAYALEGIARILRGLPSLERIKISCGREKSTDVVFEHENIHKVNISTIEMEVESSPEERKSKKLTLIMYRLAQVEVVQESFKRILRVKSIISKSVKYIRQIDM